MSKDTIISALIGFVTMIVIRIVITVFFDFNSLVIEWTISLTAAIIVCLIYILMYKSKIAKEATENSKS